MVSLYHVGIKKWREQIFGTHENRWKVVAGNEVNKEVLQLNVLKQLLTRCNTQIKTNEEKLLAH